MKTEEVGKGEKRKNQGDHEVCSLNSLVGEEENMGDKQVLAYRPCTFHHMYT